MKIAFGGKSCSLFIRRNPHQDREKKKQKKVSIVVRLQAHYGFGWEVLWRLGQRRTQSFLLENASKDFTIYCSCHHEPTTELKQTNNK